MGVAIRSKVTKLPSLKRSLPFHERIDFKTMEGILSEPYNLGRTIKISFGDH